MGLLSKFEGKMEDTVEGAADRMGAAPLSPVQIAKKAEKQMRREKMVGAGKQYAPTLYTVLVNADDDRRLLGYYPTLAGETETYLSAKAAEQGLVMDGQPLVRFIVDDDLRHGKFDVIAEMVASPLVEQLRQEEYARYGIRPGGGNSAHGIGQAAQLGGINQRVQGHMHRNPAGMTKTDGFAQGIRVKVPSTAPRIVAIQPKIYGVSPGKHRSPQHISIAGGGQDLRALQNSLFHQASLVRERRCRSSTFLRRAAFSRRSSSAAILAEAASSR
mgnify:CR=1 FL=1